MSSKSLSVRPDQISQLIELSVLTEVPDVNEPAYIAGVSFDQQAQLEKLIPAQRTSAAVLVPIVERPEGLTLLFTQRASHLRRHAGQISFPGGRIEPADTGPMSAALRETEEEIGLSRDCVRIIGYLPKQIIFTGYCVTPVVGFVRPEFDLRLDENEVSEAFEVPITHFLDTSNHQSRERWIGELAAQVYDFHYGERRIWGATAGIIMSLYQLLIEQSGKLQT